MKTERGSIAVREGLTSRQHPDRAGDGEQSVDGGRATKGSVAGLRRHWWWLVPVVVIASILVWRATRSEQSTGGFQRGLATPVRAALVEVGDLALFSSYPGEMVGEIADISPQVSGILESIPVRIGDLVVAGETLAVINDVNLRNQTEEARGQLGVAQANERRSEAELAASQAEHRRATELMEGSLLSEQEYDRVTASLATSRANVAASAAQTEQARARLRLLERQLSDSRVVAPFAGTVADRYVDRGTLLQPGTPILRLVQQRNLRVQFRVPERDLGSVRVGVPFTATTVATAERRFAGTVERVSGEVSRSDRTAIVEGELAEPNELLKPGMYAEVRVQLSEVEQSVLVPSTAVVERLTADGSKAVGVFVAEGSEEPEGEAQLASWVDVELLGSSQGRTAVRGALEEGALVLTLGQRDLRNGAPIRVVQVEGAGPPTAPSGVDDQPPAEETR